MIIVIIMEKSCYLSSSYTLSLKSQLWLISPLSSTTTTPISIIKSGNKHPLYLSHSLRRTNTYTPFKYIRRDSDAAGGGEEGDDQELFGRRRKMKRRRWWSDESPSEMGRAGGDGVLEEFVDSIWIFKVFGFYGWFLPPILISILLASGPKAFLMALTVPIGQSTLTLAFKKLSGLMQDNTRRGFKKKKKSRGRTTNKIEIEDDEEEEDEERTKMGYRSWVSDENGTSNNGNEDSSNFKGWDELDNDVEEFDMGSVKRSGRMGRSRKKRKFVKRERDSELPLLLKLLIAIFPFLGSWTKML